MFVVAVTRYDLVTNYRCGSSIEEMEHSDDGEWIRYEDVEAMIRAAQGTPPGLKALVLRWQRACRMPNKSSAQVDDANEAAEALLAWVPPGGQAPAPVAQDETDYKARYFELLYQVASKFHGESRHETALRYLRQYEARDSTASAALAPRETARKDGA